MGRGSSNPTNGGGARLMKKEDKESRALVFMLERVAKKSIAEIAAEYNVSRVTVAKYLDYARENNLVINEARKFLGHKLVPLAIAVYELHLREGSLEAAQDLLFGMGALQKNSVVKHEAGDANDTLEAFREAYFTAKDAVIEQKALPAEIIDDHEPIK